MRTSKRSKTKIPAYKGMRIRRLVLLGLQRNRSHSEGPPLYLGLIR
jgi:hypothetical protein